MYVVDNASSDHTPQVLESARAEHPDLPLVLIRSAENLGGAGGFHRGVKAAYDAGHDRIWLMDDDVVPAPECLRVMAEHPGPALMAVREDRSGRVCEKAATRVRPRPPVGGAPQARDGRGPLPRAAPDAGRGAAENVAFEGFMVHRRVVDAVGLPDPGFFIFYDDVDYAVRVRRAGFQILALRDAVLVRQLDFDQQHDMKSWKGFYMYRNLFVVHLRYGENALVRLKPWLITLVVLLLAPVRGGLAEARNVTKALRDAPRLARTSPPRG